MRAHKRHGYSLADCVHVHSARLFHSPKVDHRTTLGALANVRQRRLRLLHGTRLDDLDAWRRTSLRRELNELRRLPPIPLP